MNEREEKVSFTPHFVDKAQSEGAAPLWVQIRWDNDAVYT